MPNLDSLRREEQFIVNELQSKYEQLSPEAQAVVAQGVSWAERNIWPYTLILGVTCLAAGHFLL